MFLGVEYLVDGDPVRVASRRGEVRARALERIRALQAQGRPLRYDGPVDEAVLARAYATCDFTVF